MQDFKLKFSNPNLAVINGVQEDGGSLQHWGLSRVARDGDDEVFKFNPT